MSFIWSIKIHTMISRHRLIILSYRIKAVLIVFFLSKYAKRSETQQRAMAFTGNVLYKLLSIHCINMQYNRQTIQ